MKSKTFIALLFSGKSPSFVFAIISAYTETLSIAGLQAAIQNPGHDPQIFGRKVAKLAGVTLLGIGQL